MALKVTNFARINIISSLGSLIFGFSLGYKLSIAFVSYSITVAAAFTNKFSSNDVKKQSNDIPRRR